MISIVSAMPNGYELSQANASDIDEILLIERLAQPSPWTAPVFEQEMTLDHSFLWVARSPKNRIVGYLSFWLIADEIHILNVVVHPHYHRQGLGSGIIHSLLLSTSSLTLVAITLEVRESNKAARALYQKFGFLDVGRRPNYYTDNQETAILMTKVMQEPR